MIIRNRFLGRLLNSLTKFLLHVTVMLGRFFPESEEKLYQLFIRANNYLTYHRQFTIQSKQLLLLLPHCLQNSDCNQKITQDINNCQRCGKCQICDLVKMKECYQADFYVVDGGTMARHRLNKGDYHAVIGVACERELESGILYSSVPVIAIINKRPHGPCTETQVDLEQVTKALQFFLGNKEEDIQIIKEVKAC